MAYYRLYFLNRHSGHIDGVEEFDAAEDSAAIERADRCIARAPFELWSGPRKIYRREALPHVGAAALSAAQPGKWRIGARRS